MSSKIEVTKLAKFCNMSTETIMRFVEADYIKVLEKNDNQIFVNANQACALFGVNPEKLQSDLKVDNNYNNEEVKNKTESEDASSNKNLNKEDHNQEKHEINNNLKKEYTINVEKNEKETDEKAEVENKTAETKEKIEADSKESNLFKKITELQEELLKKQDLEIEDLRKQRKWLQTRVEVLEQKLDREQLLLLSQTQVVNQLIKKKKMISPFQKALAWFGVPTKDDSSQLDDDDNVVEMKKNKKKDAA